MASKVIEVIRICSCESVSFMRNFSWWTPVSFEGTKLVKISRKDEKKILQISARTRVPLKYLFWNRKTTKIRILLFPILLERSVFPLTVRTRSGNRKANRSPGPERAIKEIATKNIWSIKAFRISILFCRFAEHEKL